MKRPVCPSQAAFRNAGNEMVVGQAQGKCYWKKRQSVGNVTIIMIESC